MSNPTPGAGPTYRTSVNPSPRNSSSATYCGATQMVSPALSNLIVVVSGGGSAAAGPARKPTRPAVPVRLRPLTNSRRLQCRLVVVILSAPSSARQRRASRCFPGEDPLRAPVDLPRLVETEREKAHRVGRVVLRSTEPSVDQESAAQVSQVERRSLRPRNPKPGASSAPPSRSLEVASDATLRCPRDMVKARCGCVLRGCKQGQGVPVPFVHGALSDHRPRGGQREAAAHQYRYVALRALAARASKAGDHRSGSDFLFDGVAVSPASPSR